MAHLHGWGIYSAANKHIGPEVDVLEGRKMGKLKDLSNFDRVN